MQRAVITLSFDYKQTLNSLLSDLEKTLGNIDTGDGISNNLKLQVQSITDAIERLKRQVNETTSKMFGQDEFRGWVDYFEGKLGELNVSVQGLKAEMGSMGGDTAAAEEFRKRMGAVEETLQRVDSTVKKTDADIISMVKRASRESVTVNVDLDDKPMLANLKEIERRLKTFKKIAEENDPFELEGKSSLQLSTDLKNLLERYQILTDAAMDSQEKLDAAAKSGSAQKIIDDLAVDAELSNLQLIELANNIIAVYEALGSPKSLSKSIKPIQSDIDTLQAEVLDLARDYADQLNGTVSTEFFKFSKGKVQIPIRLDFLQSSTKLQDQLQQTIDMLRGYVQLMPIDIPISIGEGSSVGTAAKQISDLVESIKNINGSTVNIKVTNLDQIVSLFSGTNFGVVSENINQFASALSALSGPLSSIVASNGNAKSMAEDIKALAPAMSKIPETAKDYTAFANGVAAISTAVYGVKGGSGKAESFVDDLTKLIPAIKDIPSSKKDVTGFANAITTLSEPVKKVPSVKGDAKAFAEAVKDLSPAFSALPSVKKGSATAMSEAVLALAPAVKAITSSNGKAKGFAQDIIDISPALSNLPSIKAYKSFVSAVSALAPALSQIKSSGGAAEIFARELKELAPAIKEVPSVKKDFSSFTNAIGSLSTTFSGLKTSSGKAAEFSSDVASLAAVIPQLPTSAASSKATGFAEAMKQLKTAIGYIPKEVNSDTNFVKAIGGLGEAISKIPTVTDKKNTRLGEIITEIKKSISHFDVDKFNTFVGALGKLGKSLEKMPTKPKEILTVLSSFSIKSGQPERFKALADYIVQFNDALKDTTHYGNDFLKYLSKIVHNADALKTIRSVMDDGQIGKASYKNNKTDQEYWQSQISALPTSFKSPQYAIDYGELNDAFLKWLDLDVSSANKNEIAAAKKRVVSIYNTVAKNIENQVYLRKNDFGVLSDIKDVDSALAYFRGLSDINTKSVSANVVKSTNSITVSYQKLDGTLEKVLLTYDKVNQVYRIGTATQDKDNPYEQNVDSLLKAQDKLDKLRQSESYAGQAFENDIAKLYELYNTWQSLDFFSTDKEQLDEAKKAFNDFYKTVQDRAKNDTYATTNKAGTLNKELTSTTDIKTYYAAMDGIISKSVNVTQSNNKIVVSYMTLNNQLKKVILTYDELNEAYRVNETLASEADKSSRYIKNVNDLRQSQDKINKYEGLYDTSGFESDFKELNRLYKEWQSLDVFENDEAKTKINAAKKAFNDYAKTIDKRIKDGAYDQINNQGILTSAASLDGVKQYLASANQAIESSVKIQSSANGEIIATYTTLDHKIKQVTLSYDELNKAFRVTAEMKGTNNFFKNFTGTIQGVIKYASMYLTAHQVISQAINGFKQGIETIKEIDKQFTEMWKVSEEPVRVLQEYVSTSFEVAKALGTTSTAILSSTADYMRLGKTLEEASELANATTILMNVSEFTSINDATDALISMTQAYKDLDALDIVDKLNNIGNNFSISTSDLGESLQKVSGTLKVAGNTIDEAIALVTAGNAILQDPAKVATGLRTISLRITGTKAAKEELADLGEDVDDFVVTTSSKLNDTVMGLTKTASNPYGVKLLDDNGNYRSTYQILLDIAKVWHEINEEDKRTGENRQNALLELLAGKNRSNVLASILDDWQLLESVYESSLQSSGSAMDEQNKYLESIEGRLNVLSTSVQDFWNTFIDSESFKIAIDFLTKVVDLITKVVDTIGSAPSIATIVGAFFGFKGAGVGQLLTGIPSIINGVSEFFSGNQFKTAISLIDQLDFSSENLSTTLLNTAKSSGITNKAILKLIEGTNGSKDSMMALREELQSSSSGFKLLVKNIGSAVLTSLALTTAMAAIQWGIQQAQEAIYNSSVEKHAKDLSDVQEKYDSIQSSITELQGLQDAGKLTKYERERLATLKAQSDALSKQVEKEKELVDLAKASNGEKTLGFNFDSNTLMKQAQEYGKEFDSYIVDATNSINLLKAVDDTYQDFYGFSHQITKENRGEAAEDLKEYSTEAQEMVAQYVEAMQEVKSLMDSEYIDKDSSQYKNLESIYNVYKTRLGILKGIQETNVAMNKDLSEEELVAIANSLAQIMVATDGAITDLSKYQNMYPDLYSNMRDLGYYLSSISGWVKPVVDVVEEITVSFQGASVAISNVKEDLSTIKEGLDESKSTFSDASDDIDTLRDAINKLHSETLTLDEVRDLLLEFPSLTPFVDLDDLKTFGDLETGLLNAIQKRISDASESINQEIQNIYDNELLGGAIDDSVISAYEAFQSSVSSLKDSDYDIGNLIFGNVDASAREGLEITKNNLSQYSDALASWGIESEEAIGKVLTSLADTTTVGEYDIAFTPVLQTSDGSTKLLSSDAINQYFSELYRAYSGRFDRTQTFEAFALEWDKTGADGISNIIADIGETAQKTAEAMNTYDYGNSALSLLKTAADAAGISIEELFQKIVNSGDVQAIIDMFNRLLGDLGSESDKAFASMEERYDNMVSDIGELATSIDNLLSGSMTVEDVIELMRKFPELLSFDDIDLNDDLGFGNLYNHLLDLVNVKPQGLVNEMIALRDSLPDGDDRNQLTLFIDTLNRLSDLGQGGLDANAIVDTTIWDDTNHVIETTLSYYDDLAKLNELVADGFVVTAEKAAELINIFPQLAEGIEEYGVAGDGMIKLNEGIVNGILEGSDTSIEAQIAALESEKATLEGRKAAAEAQLELAQSAANGTADITKAEAVYEIETAQKVANEQIEADRTVDESDALAKQDMIDNTLLVDDTTSSFAQNFAESVGSASSAAATSVGNNAGNMQRSFISTMLRAQELGRSIEAAGRGKVSGSNLGVSSSGSAGYVKSGKKTIAPKVTKSDLKKTELNKELDDLITNLQLDISSYTSAISKIDGQITVLRNLQGSLNDRFKTSGSGSGSGGGGGNGGGGGGGGSDASEAAEEFSEMYDWIEIAINRIEEAIDRLEKTASDTYLVLTKRNSALRSELANVQDEIVLQQEAYATYMSVANSIDLPEEYKKKVREGMLQIEDVTDETLSNAIEQYQEWYDKAIACSDAIQDLTIKVGDLYKQNFELYESASDNSLDEIEHRANLIENALAKADARGFMTAQKYYDALLVVENENLKTMTEKREKLVKSLAEAVSSGSIEVYSESWYEMQSAIDGVTESIQESRTQLIEYENSIRDLHWERFDYLQERIDQINEETEFLLGLMEETKLFTETGDMTNLGLTAFGLRAVNYNTYLKQAEMYADEMAKIEKDLASDPYDTVLIERREELLKLQREAIENAQDEKEAIKDLVSDGFDKFLDSLKDSIDSYKDLMSEWQDTYQFQKDVEEAAKQITNLEKTVAAYTNDDSEYGMLMRQQSQNSLDEARQSLEEKQRDHYLSETEKMLDELYSNAEELLNARLDNIDQLMIDIIDQVNANSGVIGDTLREVAEENGTTISNAMETIWSGAEGIEYSITPYLEKIGEIPSGVVTAISNIEEFVRTLAKAAEDEASAEVKAEEAENIANTVTKEVANKIAPVPTKTTSTTNTTSSNSSANTTATTSSTSSATTSAAKGGFFSKLPFRGNKNALSINTSIVDRLKFNDIDSSFAKRATYYQAMGLGSASSYVGSAAQNIAMLNWMKKNGYRKGTAKIARNQWAMTQEDGDEAILRPGMGVITPLKSGDSVLTANATKFLYEFANDPGAFLDGLIRVPSGAHGSVSIGDIQTNVQMEITLPNVKNYDDFLRSAQSDPKFERLVQACSINQLAGASSAAKRNIRI